MIRNKIQNNQKTVRALTAFALLIAMQKPLVKRLAYHWKRKQELQDRGSEGPQVVVMNFPTDRLSQSFLSNNCEGEELLLADRNHAFDTYVLTCMAIHETITAKKQREQCTGSQEPYKTIVIQNPGHESAIENDPGGQGIRFRLDRARIRRRL